MKGRHLKGVEVWERGSLLLNMLVSLLDVPLLLAKQSSPFMLSMYPVCLTSLQTHWEQINSSQYNLPSSRKASDSESSHQVGPISQHGTSSWSTESASVTLWQFPNCYWIARYYVSASMESREKARHIVSLPSNSSSWTSLLSCWPVIDFYSCPNTD